MNGRLIVIEGLDGSGKATQAARLTDALNAQGKGVKQISFPDYASDSSALIKMYLGGKFGSHPDDVNAYAASTFYSVDRYASYKTNWGDFYRRGGIVVSDRYTTSNAVHQCSKLPKEQWLAFLDWLFDFEYNKIGIPVPDRVVYLEVDPAVSQGLMTARYKGDESKKTFTKRTLPIWPAAMRRQTTAPARWAGSRSPAPSRGRCAPSRPSTPTCSKRSRRFYDRIPSHHHR